MSSSDDSSVNHSDDSSVNRSDDSSVDRSNNSSFEEQDVEVLMREKLSKTTLVIQWDERGGILSDVDSFIELSKGNNMVEEVQLYPYLYDNQNRIRPSDAVWEEKLGMALGNLQSLNKLSLRSNLEWDDYGTEEGLETPDWETLARVLRHIRQKITLRQYLWPTRGSEEAFARAIRGHPTIQRLETGNGFNYHSSGTIAAALATLPALESIVFQHAMTETDEEDLEDLPAFEHPEHITTLLLSPSLRHVEFDRFYFRNPVSQAVAVALKTGSPITCLYLNDCSFSDGGGGGSIVHALQRNSTVKTLRLCAFPLFDQSFFDVLTSLLLVNNTLTDLKVSTSPMHRTWLHPFFVALRMNTSLKKVDVNYLHLSDELVGGALREVFAKNSVLEELTLNCDNGSLLCDTDLISWRRTLPFLRDNKTLKSLVIILNGHAVEPHVGTLCIDTVAMLEDNISLEVLDICSHGYNYHSFISPDNYFTVFESLQKNTTLKTLRLHPKQNSISEDGEIKHLISLLEKNYGLENLDEGLAAQDTTGELGTILRLNQAGRRYLIEEDAGSIAKGVEVLVAVRDDLGCLFYHLLENPLLCDLEHRYGVTGAIAGEPVHSNKRPRTSM
jgi:hypothetical protein